MTSAAAGTYSNRWRPPAFFGSRNKQRLVVVGSALYLCWSLLDLNIELDRVLRGVPRALDILFRMIPPDFGRWELLMTGMLESIQIAIAATVFGVLLAVPLALCAARNLAPRLVYLISRGAIVAGRTLHEVIIAIFFVKLFGFGPIAGVLTLVFGSASFLGKMLAEDIENMKPGPVEAVRATGAGSAQVIVYAVVPQVIARALGVIIYRLDANLRHSTVIGIVGAGGIGQTLSASFSRYDFDFSLAILLCIIALVALGEWFSDWARRRLR